MSKIDYAKKLYHIFLCNIGIMFFGFLTYINMYSSFNYVNTFQKVCVIFWQVFVPIIILVVLIFYIVFGIILDDGNIDVEDVEYNEEENDGDDE